MEILFLIPARGGSKRIPGKNTKHLGGIPLINHTVNVVRQVAADEVICVSTDADEIIQTVQSTGLTVPFTRPAELSADTSGSREVILHALDYYASFGRHFEAVMLLQPTSPFRQSGDIRTVIDTFRLHPELDMVVSVGVASHNPYFSMFEESREGYLEKSKQGNYIRSQDAPPVYYYNGSIYLMKVTSIRNSPIANFQHVKKYVMSEIASRDIDTELDWLVCETIISNGLFDSTCPNS